MRDSIKGFSEINENCVRSIRVVKVFCGDPLRIQITEYHKKDVCESRVGEGEDS